MPAWFIWLNPEGFQLRRCAIDIKLAGSTLIEQMLWGVVLADFASIYLASLNGVSPVSVELIEKLKLELA